MEERPPPLVAGTASPAACRLSGDREAVPNASTHSRSERDVREDGLEFAPNIGLSSSAGPPVPRPHGLAWPGRNSRERIEPVGNSFAGLHSAARPRVRHLGLPPKPTLDGTYGMPRNSMATARLPRRARLGHHQRDGLRLRYTPSHRLSGWCDEFEVVRGTGRGSRHAPATCKGHLRWQEAECRQATRRQDWADRPQRSRLLSVQSRPPAALTLAIGPCRPSRRTASLGHCPRGSSRQSTSHFATKAGLVWC